MVHAEEGGEGETRRLATATGESPSTVLDQDRNLKRVWYEPMFPVCVCVFACTVCRTRNMWGEHNAGLAALYHTWKVNGPI